MTDRLAAGTSCYVVRQGRKVRGTVDEQQPKGYMVKLEGAVTAAHFSEKKVRALRPAKAKKPSRAPAAASMKIDGPTLAPRKVRVDGQPRAVSRLAKAVRSSEYLDFVRGKPCCSCAWPPRSHAHHHGPRGVGAKASDLRTVPLCESDPTTQRLGCHDHFHARGALPGKTRAETDAHLHLVMLALHDEFFAVEVTA